MAELCLDCFNEIMGKKYKKRHVKLTYDLCENCGKQKECVVIVVRTPFKFFIWWI